MKRLFAVMMLVMGTSVYAAAPARVLLLPFDSVGDSPKPWVAKAVQQNLVAELSRFSSVTPVTGESTAADLKAALGLAEKAKADYVVFGSYQAVEGDLRITGQVVDTLKKETVAGLKATGNARDLFGLEDVIANQVKRSLPQPVVAVESDLLKQPVAPAPEAEAAQPVPAVAGLQDRVRELQAELDQAMDRMRYTPPYYGGADYYDSYPVNYGYSGYYAPYVYYTVPIYSNGFHRGHHVDHHRGGGSWSGGGNGNGNGGWHGGTGGGGWHGGGNGHVGGGGGGGGIVGSQPVGGAPGYGVPAGSQYVNFGRISR
jgi:TolB-like protein